MGRKKGNEWMGIEGKSDRISTAKLGESARTNPHTHTLKRTHGVREYIYIYIHPRSWNIVGKGMMMMIMMMQG